MHVQEKLHGHFFGIFAAGPTSSEEVAGRFVPDAGEGECSFKCRRPFRAATVGTANLRVISCCITSFQISRNSVALFKSLNSRLNGLIFHSKFERFSTVDTPLLNKICKNERPTV